MTPARSPWRAAPFVPANPGPMSEEETRPRVLAILRDLHDAPGYWRTPQAIRREMLLRHGGGYYHVIGSLRRAVAAGLAWKDGRVQHPTTYGAAPVDSYRLTAKGRSAH